MKLLITVLFALLLFSCQKKTCHTAEEFKNTNPVDVTGYQTVAYDALSCDMFRVRILYTNGKRRIVIMYYNNKIISDQYH